MILIVPIKLGIGPIPELQASSMLYIRYKILSFLYKKKKKNIKIVITKLDAA